MWAIFGSIALISREGLIVEPGDGLISLAFSWALSLLALWGVCLVVAASGSLPIVVHEALDQERGSPGPGFLLGLVLACALLVAGGWMLMELVDLAAGSGRTPIS